MSDPVDWDARYLRMAELVASWSKDPDAHVGAVIVRKNRVVASGYNGFPAAVLDKQERLLDPSLKLEMTVHAEENALIVAGRDAEDATMYVHGRPVCCRCAGSIIQAGISRVVAMHPRDCDVNSKWYPPGLIARKMFGEAEINFYGKTLNSSEIDLRVIRDSGAA